MITYRALNPESEEEIRAAALIHERTPENWKSDFELRPERVEKSVKDFRQLSRDSKCQLLLALDGATIVGFFWNYLEERYGDLCAHYGSIWVHPEFRQRGIAQHFFQQGEDWARAQGAKFLHAHVFYDNQRMLDFIRKRGFQAGAVEVTKKLT